MYTDLKDQLAAELTEIEQAGTFKHERVISTPQSNRITAGPVGRDGAEVLNPGGLRRADEFVRHKMLDALGDLSLAGAPVIGAYHGVKAGHGVTNRLLRRLFATPGAVEAVILDAAAAGQLPGAGVGAADLRRAG